MKVYDEDAFFGSGEYEVLTVPEVLEFLNKEESRQFLKLCDLSEKRRKQKSIFTRGYGEARTLTNNYKGKYRQVNYVGECYIDEESFFC